LTGVGTVLADDPSLNVRLDDYGDDQGDDQDRQPLRVIADSHWRTPPNSRLLGIEGDVVIAGLKRENSSDALVNTGAQCIVLPEFEGRVDLLALLLELGAREINEVQVEAGATLCGALLQRELVDEVLIYQAPVLLGGGAVSPFAAPRLDNMDDRVHLEWIDSRRIGKDMRLRFKPVYGA
jgi:diaminohydroxyphosphoribosylaminopyrimidine deaminase/5-amino-6-(5-phosphoribosylamino)uracil reductase